MGKTRDLFKNIRDTKGTFHAKMGSIKDRHGLDLTEAEDIKKRWQEYKNLLSRARLFVTPWIVGCTKLLCPQNSLDKNTGVGCHFLLPQSEWPSSETYKQ